MNPKDFFKNIRNLQSQMDNVQEKMKTVFAEGSSGGDLIRIKINGLMEAQSVHIDPMAVDPRDIKMLEELVAAAFTDAVHKIRPALEQNFTQFQKDFPFSVDVENKPEEDS